MRGPRTAMKSGPRFPQLEKALAQKRRPTQPKIIINNLKKKKTPSQKHPEWEFLGGPVVRTPHFHCREHGFDPWSGN